MKKLTIFLSLSLLISVATHVPAKEYIEILPAQPTQTGDKIEVLEIFWYACPHCYNFEHYFKEWSESMPDDVEFRRMPGILRKSWIPHAKAYFTAEKLGILDTIHAPLFDAIHKERKNIHNAAAIKIFFANQGVDKAAFTKVYESDEVETRVKQAFIMGQRYKVTGVPAVVVNGKYMISGSTAGSFENVLKVIDQLVDKERAGTTRE